MIKIDQLKEMSVEALQNLITNAQALVNQYEKDKKKAVIKEIKTLAASANLNIDIKDEDVEKSKSVTKYRNPDNPNETWTGRGKRPKWLNDALASGKSLDDLST
jgi:DNA-binding protein H-NS